MSKKFGRFFQLDIEKDGTILTISPPMRINFNVQRNNLGSPNRASINIYNLSRDNQAFIFKDFLDISKYIRVSLYAGYEENTALIFRGNITEAYSEKLPVDNITKITCNDGYWDYMNSISSLTINKKQSGQQVNDDLIKNFSFVKKGFVESASETISSLRDFAFFGKTFDILKKINGNMECFIDNEEIQIMKAASMRDEIVLNSDSGLLKSPVKKQSQIETELIMEPRLALGNKCVLDSYYREYNGEYKLISINHSGDTFGNDWKTGIILQAPTILSY